MNAFYEDGTKCAHFWHGLDMHLWQSDIRKTLILARAAWRFQISQQIFCHFLVKLLSVHLLLCQRQNNKYIYAEMCIVLSCPNTFFQSIHNELLVCFDIVFWMLAVASGLDLDYSWLNTDSFCLVKWKPDSFCLVKWKPDSFCLVKWKPDSFCLVKWKPDSFYLVKWKRDTFTSSGIS